jgi:hypothetical protein
VVNKIERLRLEKVAKETTTRKRILPGGLDDELEVEQLVAQVGILVVELEKLAHAKEDKGVPVLGLDEPVLLLGGRETSEFRLGYEQRGRIVVGMGARALI